jgi:hypothetical protein
LGGLRSLRRVRRCRNQDMSGALMLTRPEASATRKYAGIQGWLLLLAVQVQQQVSFLEQYYGQGQGEGEGQG